MKHIGWLICGVYYELDEQLRVDNFKRFHPEIDVVVIYAKV